MKELGTYLFALTVFVNSIGSGVSNCLELGVSKISITACLLPVARPGENPWELPNVPLKVVRIRASQLPEGVWTLYGEKDNVEPREFHPVIGYLDAVIRDKTIIGSDYDHELHPILMNNEKEGLQSITLQIGESLQGAAHSPRVYHIPQPVLTSHNDPYGQHRMYAINIHSNQEFGMYKPLPPNTVYVPPLAWPRPASSPRNLNLEQQINPHNPRNPTYFWHNF